LKSEEEVATKKGHQKTKEKNTYKEKRLGGTTVNSRLVKIRDVGGGRNLR